MQSIIKKVKIAAVLILLTVCLNTHSKAQTPADDPGGPGSSGGGGGLGGDGSPIVPFDTNMSLAFLTVGVIYASTKLKKGSIL